MEYKLTFEDGSEALLSHHGTKGMKWGVWNAETKARYEGTGKTPYTPGGSDNLGGGGGGASDDDEEELTKEEYNALSPEEKKKLAEAKEKLSKEEYRKYIEKYYKGEVGQAKANFALERGDVYQMLRDAHDKAAADGTGSKGFAESVAKAGEHVARKEAAKAASKAAEDLNRYNMVKDVGKAMTEDNKQALRNDTKAREQMLIEQNKKEHANDPLWWIFNRRGYTNQQMSDSYKTHPRGSLG